MQVHIRQAKVIDQASEFHNKLVDIIIKDGSITKIGAAAKKSFNSTIEIDRKKVYETSKGEGPLCISQGWVDILADYCEPGYEQKESIHTGLNAAAKGGYTNVIIAPNTNPAISTKSLIEFVLKKAAGHTVSLHPAGSISHNIEGHSLAEMMDMQAHGAVAFTDGWQPVQNANLMLKALEYVKAFNGTVIQIPEDTSITSSGLMHEGKISTHLGMAGIPVEAETIIINRDIQLLSYTNSRLHISGVSSAAGLDMIRKAKREKLNISCSVTPYHLALTDERLLGYDSLYKVSPPLRSEKDRQALIKGLKDGTIDCIASHHRPHEWDAKAKEFEYADYGMNVQEMAFNIVLSAASDKVELNRIIDAFTNKPRELFNLSEKGLDKGYNNGLTLFTTKGNTTVNKMASASKNNPFLDAELSGKVVGIINNKSIHLNN